MKLSYEELLRYCEKACSTCEGEQMPSVASNFPVFVETGTYKGDTVIEVWNFAPNRTQTFQMTGWLLHVRADGVQVRAVLHGGDPAYAICHGPHARDDGGAPV